MNDETKDTARLATYAFRNRVQHAILAGDSSFVQPILRSRFFERKECSEDASGLVSDFEILFAAVGSSVPVEDAPLVWVQWLKYGYTSEGLDSLLHRVRRGEPPDPVTIRAVIVPSERMRLRYAMVASSPVLLPASLLPEVNAASLDSFDLGGVVAALAADAQRGRFDPAASAALPGFDAVLAWLLAARGSSLPSARLRCMEIALDIAEDAQGDAPLRCLTWLAAFESQDRGACLARVAALLNTLSSDALLPAVLGAADDIVRELDPSTPGADAIAQAVTQSALHCLRPSAAVRALARASGTLASLGRAESEELLRRAIHRMRDSKRRTGSEADECALLLSRAQLIPRRCIDDPGAAQGDTPAILAALAALRAAEGNEAEAQKILQHAVEATSSTPESAHAEFLEVTGEILARNLAGDLRQDFRFAAESVVQLLPYRSRQVAALASAFGAEPDVAPQIALVLGAMSDYRERTDALARLAEIPYAGIGAVLDLVLADTMRALERNGDQSAVAMLARIALLGDRSGSLSPWNPKQRSSNARRSLAAALMLRKLSVAADWVDRSGHNRLLPTRTSVAVFAKEHGTDSAACLETLFPELATVDGRALWEALALAFRRFPAFAPELRRIIAAIPEPSPTSAAEDIVRTEAYRAEVLALTGFDDAATLAINRVLAACRRDPDAAIRVHQELFLAASAPLARGWIERVTTDLLNRHSDADSAVKAVISNQMALHLPSDEVRSSLPLLFLGSANISSAGRRHLAMTWLARCGQKHACRFNLEDKDDTLLAHCLRFVEVGAGPLGIDSLTSFCLAAAAENLDAIGEWRAAAQLINEALRYLHRSAEGDGTPFELADAWIRLHDGAPDVAESLWPEFRSGLSGRADGREAALLCEAVAQRRPWNDVIRDLAPMTLARLVRRACLGDAMLSPLVTGALLEACRGLHDFADLLCANVIVHNDSDLACLRVLLRVKEV